MSVFGRDKLKTAVCCWTPVLSRHWARHFYLLSLILLTNPLNPWLFSLNSDLFFTFIVVILFWYVYLIFIVFFTKLWTSLVAQMVKRLSTMQVRSLGGKDLLEEEMATHSSILAWKIPWMEGPCRLQSMGSQRVGHDWATSLTSLNYEPCQGRYRDCFVQTCTPSFWHNVWHILSS